MTTLILLCLLWCILHSLLITRTASEWFRKKGGPYQGLYRIGYILFSTISLIPVLWYMYSLDQRLLFTWHGLWRLPQILLLLYSAILFYGGMRAYNTDYFLGLQQWRDYRSRKPGTPLPFRRDGVLRVVRHPWYSGGIAVLWSIGPITDITLVSKLILSGYLIIGTLLEERKLKIELGDEYGKYCRQVPMLIPWKGIVRGE
ncbi:MAG: hypothetical protein GQ559_09965 [Desulfobulbaceae bacterium]|nr:hypothetical protein [Desulfobulbaceae bacterium]